MDCIVWTSRVAHTPDDELPPPPPPMLGSATKPNKLDEDEKDRIKTMNLKDSESEQEASFEEGQLVVEDDDGTSEGEDNQVKPDAESTFSDGDELPGLSRLVIMERKKRARDMKWLSREQAELVTSVWEPMPYPCDGEECKCDDQDIFITPSSSQTPTQKSTSQQEVFQRGKSRKRPSQTSTPVPKNGRITSFF